MIELTITQDQWPTEQQADGMVLEWKVSEGDTVEQGQVIGEIVIVSFVIVLIVFIVKNIFQELWSI